jgi:hypothetical protein
MADIYQMVWDPTLKKWQYELNGAAAVDLKMGSQRWAKVSDPGGASSEGLIWYDTTDNKFKINENNGLDAHVVPLGTLIASYIDPNGTASKGSWDGYIRGGMRMPFAGVVTEIYAQMTGGTNAVINVWKTGSVWLRSSNLTLTPSSVTSFGALQNTSFNKNDALFPYIASFSGAVTQVAFSIQFKRTG